MKKYQNLDKKSLVEIVGGGKAEDFNKGRALIIGLRILFGGY